MNGFIVFTIDLFILRFFPVGPCEDSNKSQGGIEIQI